jgi:hypothetical protein
MPDDAWRSESGVWQDLLDPVDQLHVRISPQLAENRGALDRLVRQAIEFAEENRATDFTHAASSLRPSLTNPSASRHRSPASLSMGRWPRPRRPAESLTASKHQRWNLATIQHQANVPIELENRGTSGSNPRVAATGDHQAESSRISSASADPDARGTCADGPIPGSQARRGAERGAIAQERRLLGRLEDHPVTANSSIVTGTRKKC